jgi:surface antigen
MWKANMKFSLKKLISGTATAVVILPAIFAMGSQSAHAQAAACQCTKYVANARGLTQNFPHAKDWNDGYLQRNGYRLTTPQPGAIAVMETNFPGANTAFGHVGIVQRLLPGNKIEVRGANQYVGGPLFTEANCTNVRLTGFGQSVPHPGISFWVK